MSLHVETPIFESLPMGEAAGRAVFLKMECLQPTGSFKIRGIGLLCKECVDGGTSHLVSSSGGNAGFAVAYAGRQLGADVTVVVPKTTATNVCYRIEQEGAKAFEYATTRPVSPVVVTDKAAINACLRFSKDHRILVEPACGAALSVVYAPVDEIRTAQSVLVIVCGGIGVNIDKLMKWKRQNQTTEST